MLDDRGIKRRTGCAEGERREAEDKLAAYIHSKRTSERARDRAASEVLIADVLSIYSVDVAPRQSRPKEAGARITRLSDWWGVKRLSDVTGRSCRAYAEHRGSPAAARRELEDLRAAINHHRAEGLCREVVEVVLPDKGEPRTRWLTNREVAKLIWTAWHYREMQDGRPTKRRPWRHVARFILLAVYTGTRAGTVCASSFAQEEGFGWIDLERGVWYRRPEGIAETKKRRPPVPLPDRLQAHLRRWSKRQRYPVEFNRNPVGDVDKAFRLVVEASGLGEDVTPHTLRHTAATWLMQRGVELWEAAGYLGMTVETLERVYGHHSPDHLKNAVAAMDGKKTEKNVRTDAERSESAIVSIAKKRRKSAN
ncbi:site-specific integrase [Siculibacillus lacustris]|uniref:Site-specific integrase n=1 Tax=Siculibacillus lacustris TaxID=1549641 RepID=A0A4V2KSN1_9HYPH|nr:site-specific integrase [Siculibacillus lacustris]